MANPGNSFKEAIIDALREWNLEDVKVYSEVFVGSRFVGKKRKLDLVVSRGDKALGIEAKTQQTSGTAYQKLAYAIEDAKRYPEVPAPPSHKERRAMAKGVLNILHKNLSEGKLNYRFNPSGEGVCISAAGLAFIACGSSMEHGEYSVGVQRVYERINGIMQGNRFQMQPTWGTAASTVFLAELHRVTNGKKKAEVFTLLQQYADKLDAAQTPNGGWCHGYENVNNSLGYSHFIFVSSIAAHGLALARREGVNVKAETLKKAFEYFEASSNIAAGRIGYSPRSGQKGMRGPGRTAGGLLALQAAGEVERELYKNSSKYLINTFAVQTGNDSLAEGHGSAQVGIAWAAWWAAETGNYDAFWRGQGDSIAKRKNADGSFRAAPTDGEKNPGNAESGDFANAFHALMLVADYGGLSNSKIKKADPARSIFLAQQFLKQNPDTKLPESFKILAESPIQYGKYDFRPLLKTIEQCAEDLIATEDTELMKLIPSLINAEFRAKAYMHPAGGKIALLVEGNFVFVDGLLKAEVTLLNEGNVLPREQRPIKTKVSTKKPYQTKKIIKTNKDIEMPDSMSMQVKWIINKKIEITETIKVPVMLP